MSNFNQSNSNLSLTVVISYKDVPMKAFLCMSPCVIFFYVNGVMLFTLRKKAVFQETSRYILFGHMLWVDTLNLFMSVVLYICALTKTLFVKNICLLLINAATTLYTVSTVNLSLMSLERYVAICFPLRHAEINNFERTRIAICVVWIISFIQSAFEMIIFYCIDTTNIAMNLFCSRTTLYRLDIYKNLAIAFTCVFFASVCFVIIFTYASIAAVAKTATCDKMSVRKANKTVLLHLIQLGLGALSILAGVIENAVYGYADLMTAVNVMYFCFVVLILFPKCLSPLVSHPYGMRDQAFSCLFIYYFTFGKGGKVKPVIIEF